MLPILLTFYSYLFDDIKCSVLYLYSNAWGIWANLVPCTMIFHPENVFITITLQSQPEETVILEFKKIIHIFQFAKADE